MVVYGVVPNYCKHSGVGITTNSNRAIKLIWPERLTLHMEWKNVAPSNLPSERETDGWKLALYLLAA